jgi:hypothetical protein
LGATIVSQSFPSRLAAAVGLVLALTAVGGLLGVLAPALAGNVRPHPALTGTLGTAAGIFANNLGLLSVPFGLCLLGYNTDRVSRHTGDLLLLVLVTVNALRVGVELGRWRGQLIPYVPQLPLEWTALAIAASVWLAARTQPVSRRRLMILAAAIVLLLAAAAAFETWGTPHRKSQTGEVSTSVHRAGEPDAVVGDGGCHRHGFCADLGPITSRSPAPFPSPRSVPLGRLVGADRAHNNHRPPQGGITR